ncbi:MAG: chemotaxis response regulator protein-glutamate methylesterase [Xanthobacteraceae bacterium]
MSVAATLAPSAPAAAPDPLRVMIVDDAVVVRGLVSRWIDEEPGLKIVASLRNGREAVDQLTRHNPDVVLLDIDMPDLDGLEALPLLLEKKRDLVVIMSSTLTRRNAEVSLKALALGAADYIPKPATNREVTTSATFRRELIEKVRQLGLRKKRDAANARARAPGGTPAPRSKLGLVDTRGIAGVGHSSDFTLRAFALTPPRFLLIGASTGGPQALTTLVAQLTPVIERAPVLITQHMPPTFTTILAEHLSRAANCPAREAQDGEPITPGRIYLAPGGRHMTVDKKDRRAVIALDDGPLVNFCRPAVDPMFTSAAKVWGAGILALVLTGMGTDGTHGAQDVIAASGSVIAQDEASSVVWGMPGSAANAGVCSAVLPLDEIGAKVVRLFRGEKS